MKQAMIYLAVWTLFLVPPLLFAIAWRRTKQVRVPLVPLMASAILLLSGMWHPAKVWLLGPDYSDRLYATLEANVVLVLILAAYLAFKRNWFVAAGTVILAFDWLFLAVVNSTV